MDQPHTDHPLRAATVEELHARPFPRATPGSFAWFVALRPLRRSERDRAAERAQLDTLLASACLDAPAPGATHWTGQLGPLALKWESHTEFVTYLLTGPDEGQVMDAARRILGTAAGARIASARFRILAAADDAAVHAALREDHAEDSLALSRMIDDQVVVAGDFHPDPAGDMHFTLMARPGTGPARLGRILQRLCEVETYRAMAMLGLIRARDMGAELTECETRLTAEIARIGQPDTDAAATLQALLDIATRLEQLHSRTAYRFSATLAYERIVNARIRVLRESRFEGRQTFAEFMMRRFDPAMRTVEATDRRLAQLTERAGRAGELLRTRVEVELSRQNRELLVSMDRRSEQALRLQHTVEGLSVVAISYYATSLALYVAAPAEKLLGIGKTGLAAILTPLVVLATWAALRRIRKALH